MVQIALLFGLYITGIVVGVIVFWIIGARIFRIKDVIELQKEILQELKRIK
jgi:hypothetical protein